MDYRKFGECYYIRMDRDFHSSFFQSFKEFFKCI